MLCNRLEYRVADTLKRCLGRSLDAAKLHSGCNQTGVCSLLAFVMTGCQRAKIQFK